MTLDFLLALTAFSLAATITPGPNNLMVLASGVNFGFRRTVPHMFGIAGGFASLLTAVGVGLGQLLTYFPQAYTALKIAGGAYLVYLAWRIANSGPVGKSETSGEPLTFFEAAAFQWVNPKAWVMAVSSIAIYTLPASYFASVVVVILIFMLVTIPSVTLWCGMGNALRQFLSDPVRLRIFNVVMALLLIASLWPMLR